MDLTLPLNRFTTSERGFDASLNGTVTRSGCVSCPRSVPTAAANAYTGEAIAAPDPMLGLPSIHGERHHWKIRIETAVQRLHSHVRIQARAKRHVQRPVYRLERDRPLRILCERHLHGPVHRVYGARASTSRISIPPFTLPILKSPDVPRTVMCDRSFLVPTVRKSSLISRGAFIVKS